MLIHGYGSISEPLWNQVSTHSCQPVRSSGAYQKTKSKKKYDAVAVQNRKK